MNSKKDDKMSKTILQRLIINGYQVTQITLPCGYVQRFMGKLTLGNSLKMAEYKKLKGELSYFSN